jgi:hypothetical protein
VLAAALALSRPGQAGPRAGEIRNVREIGAGLELFFRGDNPHILLHRGDLPAIELAACQASGRITIENNQEVVAVEDFGEPA